MNLESMSASFDITIVREGREFTRQSLELFRLPDGGRGAKWGGLVFPIREGERIELADKGVPPGQCEVWGQSATRWAITREAHGGDSYLFLEGSAQTCSRAVRRLQDSGVAVLRSGPNLSGGIGDWFIRIGAIADGAEDVLRQVLAEATKAPEVENDTNLRERLLVQAVIAGQTAQAELRVELDRTRRVAASLASETEGQHSLKESLEAMSARLAEVEAEAQVLRAQVDAAPRHVPKANRLEAELALAAASLLPRLDFIGNSMSFIAVELPSRSIVWKALAALDRHERGQPEGWKSLSGYPGWWERHFSTGQDNQGRIYARVTGLPSRWQVLVSHKQDQAMDLRRISRL